MSQCHCQGLGTTVHRCERQLMAAVTFNSQRSAVPWFWFRAPGRALGPFSVSPQTRGMERREAPGGLRNLPEAGVAIRQPSRRASGTQRLRAVGVPGRAGPCEGPCASWRSIAARIVGGRTLLRHPTSRSTTPSVEQDIGAIRQDGRTEKSNTPVCKVLQHCGGGQEAARSSIPRLQNLRHRVLLQQLPYLALTQR